jgi:hypothetical protein
MMTRFSIVLWTLLSIPLLPAPAQGQIPAEDHAVEVGIVLWTPTPGILISSDAVGVDAIDFVEEFALENKRFREFRVSAGGSHKFRLNYVKFDYAEQTTLQRTIVFRGQTFNVNVPANGDVEWDLWRFGYEWDFLHAERGSLGVVAEAKYNKVVAAIDSPALTAAAGTEVEAWVPSFGVAGRAYPHPMFSVGGEFTGFSFNRDDLDVKMWDFDVNGAVHFGTNFGVIGGYRSIVAEYLIDDDSGDIEMKGPYFGVLLKF